MIQFLHRTRQNVVKISALAKEPLPKDPDDFHGHPMLLQGAGREFYSRMLDDKHSMRKELENDLQTYEDEGFVRAYLDSDRSDAMLKKKYNLVQRTYDTLQKVLREIAYYEKLVAKVPDPTDRDLEVPTYDDRGYKIAFPLQRQTFLLIYYAEMHRVQ